MNSQVTNMVIVLLIFQLSRKLDLEDPEVVTYVRLGYMAAQTIILSVCYFLSIKINSKNETTVLRYVEPPKPFTNEPGKPIETTFMEYDLSKLKELVKQTLIGVVIMIFLHFYWNFTHPLFIQSILPIKNIYQNQLFKIHVLGKPAEGDLKRPFKTTSPFGAMNESQQPQTDKASFKKAVKASKTFGEKDD
ncbi:9881_t:CDS:2 [Entrophospora sp. SA101]|nr:14421_t:CDS:2 [Entrophospora sp. SA101]CAJ0628164.1 10934_t:CDS:2 [Entrophospora sp. SA101]CAJ0752804.1 21911_t:CDS:2 [Entrophospora sp. SA101]CAJ0754237.1 9881_t:CDS:2 [Entrophospora sp. SA101]CAJ0839719.1 16291_t:CDS:2 [Entrophospora sp. SA101]